MGPKRCRGAACCAPTCAPTHLPRAETAPANQYPGFCVISALASICVCGIGIRTSAAGLGQVPVVTRSEEHTSELQSQSNLVCRLLLEKKKKKMKQTI